jgi:hypothetical protein
LVFHENSNFLQTTKIGIHESINDFAIANSLFDRMPLTYLKGESEDKLKVREIDGYYTFPWEVLANHDEEFRSIPTWKARNDDVMICAYPKSGIV